MAATDFASRLARLEEHIVTPEKTAEDHLDSAERLLAKGMPSLASFYLDLAKLVRSNEIALGEDDA